MNNKIALVDLIQASILLTAEQKLTLLDELPSFTEKQANALGSFLSLEQEFITDHKEEILANMKKIYEELHIGEMQTKQVFVGTGKPS
ncbi:MAG: hypothetical protein AAB542_03760 [Patescibacteria group bacterium]